MKQTQLVEETIRRKLENTTSKGSKHKKALYEYEAHGDKIEVQKGKIVQQSVATSEVEKNRMNEKPMDKASIISIQKGSKIKLTVFKPP